MVTVNVTNLGMEKALRILKRELEKDGVTREFKRHEFFVTPGEARRAKMRAAIRRARKKEKADVLRASRGSGAARSRTFSSIGRRFP
jgi:small subunit ribosomal protein S21